MKVGLGQGSGPRTVTEARGPWAAGSVGHGGCQVCRGDETRDTEEAGWRAGSTLRPRPPIPGPVSPPRVAAPPAPVAGVSQGIVATRPLGFRGLVVSKACRNLGIGASQHESPLPPCRTSLGQEGLRACGRHRAQPTCSV